MLADQFDDLGLRIVSRVRADVENLSAHLVHRHGREHRKSANNVAHVDETASVVALEQDQFPQRDGLKNELIDNEIESRSRRQTEQGREPRDYRRGS